MKRILICFLTMIAMMVSLAPAQASIYSDTSPTPEIQFSSTPSDPGTDATALINMAQQLAKPVQIYEYVRNNAVYTLYHGSRSNSINTFLGLRGNDVDLASTLIAMYRSLGIQSRYAVGTVKIGASQVMNWLGVTNINLAVSIMQDQGIQNVSLSSDGSYVSFEHAWVEAYLPYGDYRGAGADAANGYACGTGSDCHWVDLDPSFKQNQYNSAIDVYNNLSFDYTDYYNAIYNATYKNDTTRLNLNPLEIYQNQVLAYLQSNYPGKTLDDVAYTGAIITENTLILPASLPYTVVGQPRLYNSVADHDAAVPLVEPKNWGKTASFTIDFGSGITVGGGTASLADLSTKRLTFTFEVDANGTKRMVTRLDGTEIAVPLTAGTIIINGQTVDIGYPFAIDVQMDGTPAATSSGTDKVITAKYSNCVVGGYYLVATGGETSNWSQVHRAAQELLQSNQQYPMVFNPAENGSSDGCNTATGLNCTPYIDSSGVYQSGDPTLLNDKPALDALTGGLLYVAAMQYYATLHDDMASLDALNHVRTPISGYLGVVSTTYQVEDIDGTAFAVLPGGLLIDMKGITITGSWRINQPSNYSNSQFHLLGHICSSLEHETWQSLTGYDAVWTVRGIQMALANGATLLDLQKNTTTDNGQTMYSAMGYSSSPPSSFGPERWPIYGTMMDSWWYPTVDSSQSFVILEKEPTSSSDPHANNMFYYNNTFDGVYQSPSSGEYYAPSLDCFYSVQNELQSLYNTYGGSKQLNANSLCISSFPSGETINQAISLNETDYTNYRTEVGVTAFDYLNEDKGFSSSAFVYRGVNGLSASAQPSSQVAYWRNALYMQNLATGWNEVVVPSQMSTGPNFTFSVDILNTYNTSNDLTSATFSILNETGVAAGGGYVPPGGTLLQQATSISLAGSSSGSNGVPAFNNAVFTNKNTISQTNNDVVKTPSTTDPVSTVTGNNYHDETDFTIKGRGLNMAFTRTYNSAPSSTS